MRKILMSGRSVNYLSLLILFFAAACNNQSSEKKDHLERTGEFSERHELVLDRLTGTRFKPIFTDEFILADVNLNPKNPRRFYNYSGDLSGRYIEALSADCREETCPSIDTLVQSILAFQKADGRFGDESLLYKEDLINKEHTALLWGNGRLLVGLLEYYKTSGDTSILRKAVKLGDFFLGTSGEFTPEVIKRLEGLGAAGTICLTQWVEPLVMLSIATGDSMYARMGAGIYEKLPPRGIQHSHGYLTTLRGVLLLYDYDKNTKHLEYVKNAWNELVNSSDLTIYGSVKEYFGGKGGRDEACSTADFIRLSLHLYKITKDADYLEKAEFAMYNSLYFNQYFNGDFGSHTIDHISSVSPAMSACWWCCTMSGLRGLQVLNEYFVENTKSAIKINLYLDTEYTDDQIGFKLSKDARKDEFHAYLFNITKAFPEDIPVMMRIPSWTSAVKTFLNDKEIEFTQHDNYLQIKESLNQGDQLRLEMKYKTRIILADKRTLPPDEISGQVTGALCYGPYIMTVDNNLDYTFLSEPSNNIVYHHTLNYATTNPSMAGISDDSHLGDVYLTAIYKHGGIPSLYETIFRPVSEMTFSRHPYMMVSMRFASESEMKAAFSDNTMVDPWME